MTHHLHTGEAPSVAERHKTGSAGGLVEAESDFQSVSIRVEKFESDCQSVSKNAPGW